MKVVCGTDIIEISRIKTAIERNEKFLNTIFTEREIEYCESHKAQKYQHYAARFAAKEATFKAIGSYMDLTKTNWKTFEVVKGKNNKPEVKIHLEVAGLDNVDISISHCKEYATATAVAIIK